MSESDIGFIEMIAHFFILLMNLETNFVEVHVSEIHTAINH